MNKNYYGIIMAGGIGTRFWPVSTEDFPKQFHDLLGSGQTLIQKTFERLSRFIPKENIRILTNERYKSLVLEQLPEIGETQLVLEPAMRNTAPCILLSALKIQKQNPDALMLVAPSDHWIEDETAFQQNILTAFNACKDNVLMTLGIVPAFPNTGFGYIQFNQSQQEIKKVLRFTEKPDYDTAKSFLQQGNYMWNAGIFIWSTQSIITAFELYLPEMYQLFVSGIEKLNTQEERDFIEKNYALSENISIDYGILEKAKNVFTLSARFDWNDLGTWGSLYEKLPKNEQNNTIINAQVISDNAHSNIIFTDKNKKVVVSGLSGYVVVDIEDKLLIVPIEKEQEIKQWQQKFKE